jgi:hypothetical protein
MCPRMPALPARPRMTSWWIVLIGIVSLLSGCGRNLPELVPVSGRVLFAGIPPHTPGVVHFLPLQAEGNLPLRPGAGRFDTDGRFTVESFNGAKGLIPGRYRVRIECFSREPSATPGDYEKASYVPADYQPPELLVEKGRISIDDLLYDVPKKK